MVDTFNQIDSIECGEAGAENIDFQGSCHILKKLKTKMLASDNEDNCEGAERQDRFNDLPDGLVHHILSFMETKDAIRTCVLSKRWRSLWASIPCLNFSSNSFTQLVDFKKFVQWVLSRRDCSQVKVLIYCRFGVDYATDKYLLNKVTDFAASHGVENIRIDLRSKTSGGPPIEIPSSLFNCKSLKMLELKDCTNISSPLGRKSFKMGHLVHSNPFGGLAKVFGFTTLTTLHLNSFTLWYTEVDSIDPFVNCVNLKNLCLSEVCFKSHLNPKKFVISAPQLSNLTLMCNRFRCNLLVAAPQLTSLSYLYCTPCAIFEFSIPSLDDLIIDIHEAHDRGENSDQKPRGWENSDQMPRGWENSDQKPREATLHGLINMFRGHQKAEAFEISFSTVVVACGSAALPKQECPSSSKLKSMNSTVGSTYKIFINNLDQITAYFRNCSQHADFEMVIV